MNGWISLTALASTIALAGPHHAEPISQIELRIGHHATQAVCALDAVPFKPPKHVDPLTGPGHRIRCIERRRLNGRCLHVQVSVVRDHDGHFLVDLETEPHLGPGTDTLQQYRAQTVPGLAERGSILARWPRGAWHDIRVCPDEHRIYRRPIQVPARCLLLLDEHTGKPHPARFERPGERGCLVAVNTTQRPLALDVSIPPPAEGETRKHFRHSDTGTFPLCSAPRSARRWTYGLIGEWGTAWHVAHTVVLTPEAQAGSVPEGCTGTPWIRCSPPIWDADRRAPSRWSAPRAQARPRDRSAAMRGARGVHRETCVTPTGDVRALQCRTP